MHENYLKYDGPHVRVYYFPVDDFIPDLNSVGGYLNAIAARGEEILSVTPNTGLVTGSFLLGTSFQGVKGLAVITKKPEAPSQKKTAIEETKKEDIQIPTL